jgi:hypothetical protein
MIIRAVFIVQGSFVAVLNVCPHELAPVCLGAVRGTALALGRVSVAGAGGRDPGVQAVRLIGIGASGLGTLPRQLSL